MNRSYWCTAALCVAAATALSAQTPQDRPAGAVDLARVVGGSYDRSHDYDVVHQRIELRNFDWDSLTFSGRVETTLVARRAGLDSVILDAGHLLRIRSVTNAGGTLRTTSRGDTLVIFPGAPARFGDTLRFTIAYDGKVENGRGLTFIAADSTHPRQLWSQGEAMDNHFWFPTYDFPNDRETWELRATVPAEYTAVSNGRLVAQTSNPDGTRTFDWSQDKPASTYLVSLIVAPLAKLHDQWQGVSVDYYVYHADSARAWPLFHVTPDMIDVYSRLTGIPYPWDKYAQTTVANFFGGMENVSATTLIDNLPGPRDYQDRPWYQWILIPHELAHQWFGDYVTTEDWANTWLNEGFAEFMPGQYWGEKLGPHAAQDYYLDEYRQFMQIDARRRMPLAAQGSNNIYPKGALVLEMLRDYLGLERFWASLHRYLERHALGNATTDDLRQAIREAAGENVDWFFDQWMYSAGYPEFAVASSYDAAARRVTLHVRQTQQDTARADSTGLRFATPAVFRMPVAVRVGTASGDVVRRFRLDRREQDLVVDSVGAPTMVVFDEGNHILKKLTFPQPTPWLAEQLRRDADLWDRQWAIDQLAADSTNPAAARALAGALMGADYPLTREGAAQALARFAPGTALPALRAGARDTSSAVRRAVMEALARLDTREGAPLARSAFQRDPSDQVRAAALVALARADSTGVAPFIRQALADSAEAIRSAGLNALAVTHDSSFITAVEAHLADGFGFPAAIALAEMARAGSAHALAVMIAHLNDGNAMVRRAMVTGLQQLPPATVAAPLRAALAGLQYQDTRRAVEALLARPAPPAR